MTRYPKRIIRELRRAYAISELEAKRRYCLFCASGLTEQEGDLSNRFFAAPSEESMPLVVLEICINNSMANSSFVSQYDRLNKAGFAEALKLANVGIEHPNIYRQFELFNKFVEETIFSRIDPKNYTNFFKNYPA